MVASNDTVVQVVKIIRKYVNEETFNNILIELEQIQGNKSFNDTIQRIKLEK